MGYLSGQERPAKEGQAACTLTELESRVKTAGAHLNQKVGKAKRHKGAPDSD